MAMGKDCTPEDIHTRADTGEDHDDVREPHGSHQSHAFLHPLSGPHLLST